MAPLEYTGIPTFALDAIDPSQAGLWRYTAMLPVVAADQKQITLGEGWTPLIEDMWGGLSVHWKLESLMPTGSYKDRGVSTMMNWLIGLGANVVVDDSRRERRRQHCLLCGTRKSELLYLCA